VRDNPALGSGGTLVPMVRGTATPARVNPAIVAPGTGLTSTSSAKDANGNDARANKAQTGTTPPQRRRALAGPAEPLGRCAFVACGAGLTATVDASGRLFCFGDNVRGQCGVGRRTRAPVWPPEPVRNLDGEVITEVSLGLHHGVALTQRGDVRVWGDNGSGQLGTGSGRRGWTSARRVPAIEALGVRCVSIAAGMNVTAAATEDGRWYLWGKECGEGLDHGMTNPKCLDALEPREVALPAGECAVEVASTLHSSFCATASGRIFAVGRLPPVVLKADEEARGDTSFLRRLMRRSGMSGGLRDTGPLPAHVRGGREGADPMRRKVATELEGNSVLAWGETRVVQEVWEVPTIEAGQSEQAGLLPQRASGGKRLRLREGIEAACAIDGAGRAWRLELGRLPRPIGSVGTSEIKVDDVSVGWQHELFIARDNDRRA
jgi:hypothetical protein